MKTVLKKFFYYTTQKNSRDPKLRKREMTPNFVVFRFFHSLSLSDLFLYSALGVADSIFLHLLKFALCGLVFHAIQNATANYASQNGSIHIWYLVAIGLAAADERKR